MPGPHDGVGRRARAAKVCGQTTALTRLQEDGGGENERIKNEEYKQKRVHVTKSETPPVERQITAVSVASIREDHSSSGWIQVLARDALAPRAFGTVCA